MARGKMTSNKGGGVFADINITPLTDIFLVLLIIFMVTTAVTIESAAHVDLPKAEARPHRPTSPRASSLPTPRDHQIYLNDKQVTEPELMPQLHDALQNSTDKIVIFQGDPKVILGDMVRILDMAKQAGAEAIAIAVSHCLRAAAAALRREAERRNLIFATLTRCRDDRAALNSVNEDLGLGRAVKRRPSGEHIFI